MIDEYKTHAAKLIALKSVSADPKLKTDVKKTAEYLKNLLVSFGVETKLIDGYGNPVLLGSYVVDPKAQTCLIYGHYDVQPASEEDGWDTDPFEMVEKDKKLFGRGIMDDKCQFLIHILTIGELIKERKLKYNIKFLSEGEEEMGSPNMEKFIGDHVKELECDFVMISDGELLSNKPTVELGNRGLVNFTLTIQTATNELHSGKYGGAALNALHEMSKFISSLFDSKNRITIDNLYDDVDPVDTFYTPPFEIKEYERTTGAKTLLTEPEYDFYTQTGLRPGLTVTGMYGGYLQEGHKTVIPSKATAKFNLRIVMSQDPKKVEELVKKHIAKHLPDHIDYKLTFEEWAYPNKTDRDNLYVKKAEKVLEEVFSQKPYYNYVGATEPVVLYFQQTLQKPIVCIPFANEDGHMHGMNENFNIDNIKKGFEFSEKFFGK